MKLEDLFEVKQSSQFFTKTKDIKDWLEWQNITDYKIKTVNGRYFVEVWNNVDLLNITDLDYLPVQFSKVDGYFSVKNSDLKSLVGCPKIVTGYFSCENSRNLTDFTGAPQRVNSSFDCDGCSSISSFNGLDVIVDTYFTCLGCTRLTSLHDVHKHIHYVGAVFAFSIKTVKSHILGLLKITNLTDVHTGDRKLDKIIYRYLSSNERDIFACQRELIDAGYEEYAQL